IGSLGPIRIPRFGVCGQLEFGVLRRYAVISSFGIFGEVVTEGDAFVVAAKFDVHGIDGVVVLHQMDHGGVITVRDGTAFAIERMPGGVAVVIVDMRDTEIFAPVGMLVNREAHGFFRKAVVEADIQGGLGYHGFAVVGYVI